MLVELRQKWFAPGPEIKKDKIQMISGRRYNKGIHKMPNDMKEFLPTDAKILKEMPKEESKEEQSHSLREFDQARVASDIVIEKAEEAEERLKKQRSDNLAKARKAKADKKETEK